jgi:hypothetical protein
MKNEMRIWGRAVRGLALFLVIMGALGTGTFLTAAQAPTTSLAIVNNSSRDVRHLYLSATNDNNWGPDLLDPSTINGGGGTFNLSDVACPGSDIKVIAEDADGCFMYKVVACGQAGTWTITNETTRDCGN